MKTGRIKPGYGIIQRAVMQLDIDIYAKSVYCLLVSYAGENDNCFPSLNTMCNDLKISKPKLIESLKVLIKEGLIIADKRKTKSGDFTSNIYYPLMIMEINNDPTLDVVNDINHVVNGNANVVNEVYSKNNNKENVSLLNNKENIVLPFSENELKQRRKKFIKPTIAEISLVIKDKKTAQKFFNHYEGNGWMVGKTKMVDWTATANNWVLDAESKNSSTQQQGAIIIL